MNLKSMLCARSADLCNAAIVLALLFASGSWAATEIRTAAQQASEPKFVALAEAGKTGIGGICVDIMRAIERVDPQLKFVGDQTWQPLVRMEAGMAAGDLDVICGLLQTKSRESRYTYIDTPLFPVNYHLVVRADDDVQIQSWDDVRKLGEQGVVLVINGFGILDRLEDAGIKIDAKAYTSKENFAKLLAGRGRFYYHRSPGINSEIRHAGVEGKVKILGTSMHTEKFYMAASKKMPAEAVGRMQKAILQLERNGELAGLLRKWSR